MKVFQINTFGNKSTGRISADLSSLLYESGHECMIAFSRNNMNEEIPHIKFGSNFSVYCDGILTRLTDKAGSFSKSSTKKLIKLIIEYNPDIIHLHNLHGYYINIGMLFEYLRESKKPVVWTFHDCWPFTGHCSHFSAAKCERWKTKCNKCPLIHSYPKAYIDNSSENYEEKKRLFLSIENLNIVTVSRWLENTVRESFFKEIDIQTIYNGIDLNVFKPCSTNIKRIYGLEGKKIILGVASTWSENKGLDDFLKLSERLDNYHRIILLGIDERLKNKLPQNITAIKRTDSVEELVQIYNAADIYFNSSVEETFGLTTLEAMACGKPVIVYDATAIPEVCTCDTGYVVKPKDIDAVCRSIYNIDNNPFPKEKILQHASAFDRKKQYNSYIKLYEKLYKEK